MLAKDESKRVLSTMEEKRQLAKTLAAEFNSLPTCSLCNSRVKCSSITSTTFNLETDNDIKSILLPIAPTKGSAAQVLLEYFANLSDIVEKKIKRHAVVTPCHHCFHRGCMINYLVNNGQCPICKTELPFEWIDTCAPMLAGLVETQINQMLLSRFTGRVSEYELLDEQHLNDTDEKKLSAFAKRQIEYLFNLPILDKMTTLLYTTQDKSINAFLQNKFDERPVIWDWPDESDDYSYRTSKAGIFLFSQVLIDKKWSLARWWDACKVLQAIDKPYCLYLLDLYTKDLLRIFKYAPTCSIPFVVFRGLQQKPKSIRFQSNVFISTSYKIGVAEYFADNKSLLCIEIPAKYAVLFLIYSRFPSEAEILLPPGITFDPIDLSNPSTESKFLILKDEIKEDSDVKYSFFYRIKP